MAAMLEIAERKPEVSAWATARQAAAKRSKLVFEPVPNMISTSSGSLSLYRAKVPGGWLIAARPSDNVAFVPDPLHEWDGGAM